MYVLDITHIPLSMKGVLDLSQHKEQELECEHADNPEIYIIAKVIEKKDDVSWLLETVDKERQYLIRIDDEAVFEEGISTALADGNVVMMHAVEHEENHEVYTATKVMANEQDHRIKIDERETISGYLGIFPDGLLDMEEHSITIAKNKTVAITLKQDKGQRWVYDRVKDHLRLLSYHEEDEEGYKRQHWGFAVEHEGECMVHFTSMNEQDDQMDEIFFRITAMDDSLT